MVFRTDLAVERREMTPGEIPDGVVFEESDSLGIKTTKIEITNENGEKALDKPKGRYITVELDDSFSAKGDCDAAVNAVSGSIGELLSPDGLVLVAGLGNENITPDALGPLCVNRIFATRHISEKSGQLGLPELREVAAISTGVLGQTGMETGEILSSICEKIKPSAVIVIDALATGSAKRLGKTVQITDTGICPGSGVGNSRKKLDSRTLGTTVISIGVPTVIDASTLCGKKETDTEKMMVTPRDIDRIIDGMSSFLALSINLALQKNLSPEDIYALV
ncbi:MAG: GPR endopeptidase [Clostridiales bacterium]|nr:GPR endopeptidase [Clostridiales bacterium]